MRARRQREPSSSPPSARTAWCLSVVAVKIHRPARFPTSSIRPRWLPAVVRVCLEFPYSNSVHFRANSNDPTRVHSHPSLSHRNRRTKCCPDRRPVKRGWTHSHDLRPRECPTRITSITRRRLRDPLGIRVRFRRQIEVRLTRDSHRCSRIPRRLCGSIWTRRTRKRQELRDRSFPIRFGQRFTHDRGICLDRFRRRRLLLRGRMDSINHSRKKAIGS